MRSASLVLLVSLASGAAVADNIELCFRSTAAFGDSGYELEDGTTEDHWAENVLQPIRGAEVVVRRRSATGPVLFKGYLGDGLGAGDPGSGCTGAIDVASARGVIHWEVTSIGSVQGNTLRVQLDATDQLSTIIGTEELFGPNPYDIAFESPSGQGRRVWNVYNAAAFALYRHAGGLSGRSYTVEIDAENSAYSWGTAKVTSWGAGRKFVIAHELGHRLADQVIGSAGVAAYCSSVTDNSCPASAGHHSMGSKESAQCAFVEGLAHFYAADVWNRHGERDCVFRYYKNEHGTGKPVVNCAAADPLFPVKYLEERCSSPFDDRGVELDWLRAFWAMHSGAYGDSPSFTAMVRWMRDAFVLDSPFDNVVKELDDEANVVGGAVKSTWDRAKKDHGIDHR